MPDLDGLDVLRTLRRKGIDIATIVISAHGSREIVAEAMNLGAIDFLVKPFDPQHLERVVRGVLGRPPASVGES
jgi:FixJ family two-component response regulator